MFLLIILLSILKIINCDQTYYEILGVSHNADQKMIKSQYRKLSKSLHPDKNNAANAEETWHFLNEGMSVNIIIKLSSERCVDESTEQRAL